MGLQNTTFKRRNCEPCDGESKYEEVLNEISILQSLGKHDSNTYLREYFVEGDKVYLIMELLNGGELLHALSERGNLPEEDARSIITTVLRGVRHMHQRQIAHRDLKLENLLLVDPDCISRVKITDFGFSKKLANGVSLTVSGTPLYVAPEALRAAGGTQEVAYGLKSDIWACGVILYMLLGGYPPFMEDKPSTNCSQLFKKILNGEFTFRDPVWELISQEAKDLITKLLTVDPERRLSADEALKHQWCIG
eukprot:CAMPEP_0177589292 /NCGR_PEP_ID=MMETSP0419_2-20121207/6719_1 /TAXON_ID=582737 /ORGANISM="Tetraselmis sp., Strain GSL018" /LENGTH=250 /DNA_ID=CAMNT_0019079623 /DNA_START=700 /DNA_END=1453 /DNA_ORIENTATION=-